MGRWRERQCAAAEGVRRGVAARKRNARVTVAVIVGTVAIAVAAGVFLAPRDGQRAIAGELPHSRDRAELRKHTVRAAVSIEGRAWCLALQTEDEALRKRERSNPALQFAHPRAGARSGGAGAGVGKLQSGVG